MIVTLGEAVIDFVSEEPGVDLKGASGFHKMFGGAPANVAIGVTKLGVSAGFVGKVGNDAFGHYLEEELIQAGVDTSCLYFSEAAKTTLTFVSLTSQGDRDFVFYRDPGADALLLAQEITEQYIQGANALHLGSISFISSVSRDATCRAIEFAKNYGLTISMDPNIRLSLWKNEEEARKVIRDALVHCDLCKLSKEEAEFLSGKANVREAASDLLELGPGLVIVTLGPRGCFYKHGSREGTIEGYEVQVKDTTGAGDAFTAGFLSHIVHNGLLGDLISLEEKDLVDALRYANAVAAMTTTDYGATSAFPDAKQVDKFIEQRGVPSL